MRIATMLQTAVTVLAVAAGILPATAGPARGEAAVAGVEVREIGISPADESKSVVEVRWRRDLAEAGRPEAFRLHLSVHYADGSLLVVTGAAGPDDDRMRFEVPSARLSARRPPAFIVRMRAVVTAVRAARS